MLLNWLNWGKNWILLQIHLSETFGKSIKIWCEKWFLTLSLPLLLNLLGWLLKMAHKGMEKEPGMFGNFIDSIIGKANWRKIVIEHLKNSKRFDFTVNSSDSCYLASYFSDCSHTLIVAFNLVRTLQLNKELAIPSEPTNSHDCLLEVKKNWTVDSNVSQ